MRHTHYTIRYLLLTSIRNQRVKASGRRRGGGESPKNVCGVHLVDIILIIYLNIVQVIRGLQRGQHYLPESSTGSGKTLALF